MILDPNTRDGIPVILDANKAACSMHGYLPDDFIGRPIAEIDDDEGKLLVKKQTKEIMTGKPFYFENTHVHKEAEQELIKQRDNRELRMRELKTANAKLQKQIYELGHEPIVSGKQSFNNPSPERAS